MQPKWYLEGHAYVTQEQTPQVDDLIDKQILKFMLQGSGTWTAETTLQKRMKLEDLHYLISALTAHSNQDSAVQYREK